MLAHAFWWLNTFCGMALLSSVAVAQPVVLASSCDPTNSSDLVCSYTVNFRDHSASSMLSVRFQIPNGVELDRSSVLDCLGSSRRGRAVQFQPPVVWQDRLAVFEFVTNRRTGCFRFQLRAPKAEYQGKNRPYYWSLIGRGSRSGEGQAIVPARRSKASIVRFMTGPAFTLHLDDSVDFLDEFRCVGSLVLMAVVAFAERARGLDADRQALGARPIAQQASTARSLWSRFASISAPVTDGAANCRSRPSRCAAAAQAPDLAGLADRLRRQEANFAEISGDG